MVSARFDGRSNEPDVKVNLINEIREGHGTHPAFAFCLFPAGGNLGSPCPWDKIPQMNICDYVSPVVAHNIVVLTVFLTLLIGIRLIQGKPLFTWRDVLALVLILTWAYYFRNSMHPMFH